MSERKVIDRIKTLISKIEELQRIDDGSLPSSAEGFKQDLVRIWMADTIAKRSKQ